MCGIAGIYKQGKTITENHIRQMTEVMAHRGPDGYGYFIQNNVALGHRRLSIIDIETGKQPMCNEDENIWITFNGEIYNYKELQYELKKHGHIFKTNSDTEVIIHGYEQWGTAILNRLRGMFAFGIADFKLNQLFLARDHFGIKPLVYRIEKDSFFFASELNALRVNETEPPKGNPDAVMYYLKLGYIPAPFTIYQSVYKLPPAHYLTYDMATSAIKVHRYWNFDFNTATNTKTMNDWQDEVDAVLTDSVKAHLIADVPVGAFLSGGIDSTLITLKAASLTNKSIEAFSIGFDDEEYSELKYAKTAADRIGIKLHYEIVREADLNKIPHLVVNHYGEPFEDSSMLPTWYVSKLAREKVPVVLSGDGGDEFFAGYPHFLTYLGSAFLPTLKRKLTARQYLSIPRYLLGMLKLRLKHGNITNHLNDWENIRAFVFSTSGNVFSPLLENRAEQSIPTLSEIHQRIKKFNRLSYAQYMDICMYLPYDILTKVDIASMANSLEARPPIIDTKVLEVAAKIPARYLIGAPDEQPETKKLLKQLLTRYFPNDFVYRKKQGFVMPRKKWMENDTTKAFINGVIFDKNARLDTFFNLQQLEKNIRTNSANEKFMWKLFILGLWYQKNTSVSFS